MSCMWNIVRKSRRRRINDIVALPDQSTVEIIYNNDTPMNYTASLPAKLVTSLRTDFFGY